MATMLRCLNVIALLVVAMFAMTGCGDEPVTSPVLVSGDAGGSKCPDGGSADSASCPGEVSVTCDDGNPCTDDKRDPTTGVCVSTNKGDGTTCEDGDKCSILDTCTNGVCAGIPNSTCSDGNECTNDNCDPKTGKCTVVNNDASCDDGSACTVGDKCQGAACVPGKPLDCDDKSKCTNDSCEPKMGGCKHDSINCNDKNSCTNDMCDPMTGCSNMSMTNGAGCDDGNACTTADKCQGGICNGGPAPSCDDNNPCTGDSCDPATGCAKAPLTGQACDDGKSNTINDTCQAGVCVGGAPSCDDKNPCTNDTGNGVSEPCAHTPSTCDDGKACTVDSCDFVKGCVVFNTAAPCDDGNACTVGEKCSAGICSGGAVPVCNDNNPCTGDACDPKTGCVFPPLVGVACNDGNACTTNDQCGVTGNCVSGPVKECDDANSCTADKCEKTMGGCLNIGLSGQVCSDGQNNTVNDVCSDGVCKGSSIACDDSNKCTFDEGNPPGCKNAAIICDDKNPCTDDGCDKAAGCQFKNNIATCDDGNFCTSGDICANGICTGGAVSKCDDKDPCTADKCDPKTGACSATAIPGCGVGEVCGNGLDDDGDLKVDCNDSECKAEDDAFELQTWSEYDGIIEFKVSGKSELEKFDLKQKTPQAWGLKCKELPFAALLKGHPTFEGSVKVWVEGYGSAPGKPVPAPTLWNFDVWEPAPQGAPTTDTFKAPSVKGASAYTQPKGYAIMVRWPGK